MNETVIHYRAARPVDADQVYRLIIAAAEDEGTFIETPDEVVTEDIRLRIRNVANRRNRLFLVATDDERIVGMVSLESYPQRALQHVRVLALAVEPRYRRKGIGRELLRQAVQWAKDTPDVEKIEITLREINTIGLKLIQSFGFESEGRLKRHVALPNGRQMDDILLALFVDHKPPKNA